MPRGRILIVEEDAVVRGALATAMSDAGAEVVVAADGLDALGQLRSGPRPSVILVDLGQSRPGAEDFLRALRADPRFEHVAVITITGETATHDESEHRSIDEPLDVNDLRRIVLSLCDLAAA